MCFSDALDLDRHFHGGGGAGRASEAAADGRSIVVVAVGGDLDVAPGGRWA